MNSIISPQVSRRNALKLGAAAGLAGTVSLYPGRRSFASADKELQLAVEAKRIVVDSVESNAIAIGPATDDKPVTKAMHEMMGQDLQLLQAWEQSFGGRPIFKWVGFVTIGAVALILVLFTLLGLNGVLKMITRRS